MVEGAADGKMQEEKVNILDAVMAGTLEVAERPSNPLTNSSPPQQTIRVDVKDLVQNVRHT